MRKKRKRPPKTVALPDPERPTARADDHFGDKADPERPTARADVYFGDEAFERRLENVTLDLGALGIKLHVNMSTWSLSPVPLAISGSICLIGLTVAGAPMWARLAGMLAGILLPIAIALIWSALRLRERRNRT